MTEENLRDLAKIQVETAIAVIDGEIVLFTSGSDEEIRISRPARRLIEGASVIGHTHPSPHQTEGPSDLDIEMARDVCACDDEVDDIHANMYANIQGAMLAQPDHIELLTSYLSVSRYLERIADHATNIAEDVMYLIEGNIVRHSGGIY